MEVSNQTFMEPRAPASLTSMDTSPYNSIGFIDAFTENTSAHPFMQTFIPNTSAFIKPLSHASSIGTFGPFPCHPGFLQTSLALHSANPYTYTAPPINMVINKTELSDCRNDFPSVRRIKDSSSRQVAFCKRRTALFKKAHELSVLCDAEIAILIFSPSGKLSEFASSSMSHIMERYQSFQPQMPSNNPILQDLEIWKNEAILLNNRLKCLQEFQRCVFERTNTPLSINEVQSIEPMLENALDKIRKRKEEILYKENNVLKEKLIQIIKMKECVSNASSGWKELSFHQESVSTKLQLGLDTLQCTQVEKN